MFTYAEIVADYERFKNKQPNGLYLGSDPVIPVTSWKQASELTTTYLCQQFGLPPLPFPTPDSYGASFINTTAHHANGKPFNVFYMLEVGGRTVYVNRYLTVFSIKKHVAHLFDAVSAPPDVVKVSIGT